MSPQDFLSKLKLPFRKDRELYRSLYHILGFYPKNIALYKQALMHKSAYSRRLQGQSLNNERLEFLGDAVLDAVVGDIVYHHFKGKPEGFLTNTRSKIVQRESLNRIAAEMGVDRLIKSSDNVRNSHNSNLNGNAFEALVGAVYEDRGYDYCKQFMERRILKSLVNIDKIAYKEVNFKSKLLEWSQKNKLRLDFELVAEGKEGATSPTFQSRVVIEGVECGQGKGYTKKESQQLAAKDALLKLKRQHTLEKELFAAKSKRTAMDEQPIALLPDVPMDAEPSEKRTQSPSKPSARKKGRGAKEASKNSGQDAKDSAQGAKDSAQDTKDSGQVTKGSGQQSADPAKKQPKASRKQPADSSKTSGDSAQSAETATPADESAPKKERRQKGNSRTRRAERARKEQPDQPQPADELPIDFSDVTARPKTREEIIAQAEEEALRQA